MEELLLRALLAADELDVVDEQHVRLAVPLAEGGGVLVADGGDDVVGELVALDVDDVAVGLVFADLGADRVEQVGLAQPGAAVDEEGVVGVGGVGRDGKRGRVRELVGGADDEGVEGVVVLPAAHRAVRVGGQRLDGRGLSRRGAVAGDVDADLKAEDLLEGGLEDGGVLLLDDVHLELGVYL